MNNLTARAYVISGLSDSQVDDLHEREIESDYPYTSSMIHESYATPSVGEVPVELHAKPESQILAIHERVRSEYKLRHIGCCFKDKSGFYDNKKDNSGCSENAHLAVVHKSDWIIRKDKRLSLPVPSTGGKAREKMLLNEQAA